MMRRSTKTLLVVDDDQLFSDSVIAYFSNHEINVLKAHTGKEGQRIIMEQNVDVVLLDQKLPDVKGIELCEKIVAVSDQTKIIFITAYPSLENAVHAVRVGAYDYLSKPFDIDELEMTVNRALRTKDLEQVEQIQLYKRRKESNETNLIGKINGLKIIWDLIKVSAENVAPVLITGETGTGKNIAAKCIHQLANNSNDAFLSINCAALPENMIEAELFGFEKGAFTGALYTKKGVFEMAEGGTLFLDEIGELPHHLQSKLLGVLDDKKVKRIGGQSLKLVNARIIVATNIDIEDAVKKKRFREDLYYRLCVIRIHMPPLRTRLDDIPMLCGHFIKKLSPHSKVDLSKLEITKLMNYSWPGNVRELKNVIERAIILRKDGSLYPSRLIDYNKDKTLHLSGDLLTNEKIYTLEEIQRKYIHMVLKKLNNNHSQAAITLGISRSTLLRKPKKYNIVVTN